MESMSHDDFSWDEGERRERNAEWISSLDQEKLIGPVTGLGARTTGVLGLRSGPGTLRTGGPLVQQSSTTSSTAPRMNHHRMLQL